MLEVVSPSTFVSVTVGPHLGSLTLYLSVHEVTGVNGVVGPGHLTLTGNDIVSEVSLVKFACLCEIIFSFSMEITLVEISLVGVSLELELSFSGSLSFDKVSLVPDRSKVKYLFSLTMVHVVLPLAFVFGTTLINVNTISVCFTVNELSLIDITV